MERVGSDRWWKPPLRAAFAGRRVLIAGAVAAAWVDHVDVLRSLGVDELMVYATTGRGAGPVPDVPTVTVEPSGPMSIMERTRFDAAMLREPPPHVVDAIERFDPDGSALVVGSFLSEADTLLDRPFVAWRRPEWVALEDKTVVDAFWDRAGIARRPSVVVERDAAADIADSLDEGAGTVWTADALAGWHGGAQQTHWVTDAASRARAYERLPPHCRTVRIMPFVDGVPCSIHGLVLPDGVAVLRPVELVVLRRGNELVYAGCATFFDPPGHIRAQMRDIARLAGRRLATEVSFRGCFTVDGVARSDGFWPTELNPRFGAGIMTIARSSGLPILLLNDLIVAGHPLGVSAEQVEESIVDTADRHRGGGTWITGITDSVGPLDRDVGRDADGSWSSSPAASRAAHVVAGPDFVRCTYEPDAVPVGPPTASLAASFWCFADREFGTSVGTLTAPEDPFVRGRARPGR